MNIQELKKNKLLLLDCISGSRAYGLQTSQSDTDIKGVFLLPKRNYYGLDYVEQVNNETNDEMYYELKRYIDLLVKNNPNILELLNTPEDCIRFRHPVMNRIKPQLFLSKLCKETFAGYALTQIRKAKGLNKKIHNPVGKDRKTILDFCYIIQHHHSIPLREWLHSRNLFQEHCGLVSIPHLANMYALFHNSQLRTGFMKGIYSGPEANEVSLSSVEKEIEPLAILGFNKDAYSTYCKDYKEYWQWVETRNETRYENTKEHGKNYDAKNVMHTFRLLNMAEEIALEGKVNVRRPDREFLLEIRSGKFSYDQLLKMADEKIHRMDELFERSDLPESPDKEKAGELLIEMREKLYRE